MGRIGIPPEEAVDFIVALGRLPGIDVQGLMTHFADADLRDKEYASKQLDRFESLITELSARGITIPFRHAANSAAILDYHRALFTMVRPGLMLYGYNPLEAGVEKADLRPVLSLVTRIAFLKKVPTGVPISYGRTFVTQAREPHCHAPDRVRRWLQPQSVEYRRGHCAGRARAGSGKGMHGYVHDRCDGCPWYLVKGIPLS